MAKVNIMIVEDDAITALDIENQLKNLGYDVSAKVSRGEEAIQKAKENTPDLVLMDIMLKGEVDGIEVAEEIRTQFDIPVIFLTAHADRKRLERAKFTMPFGYILKPFQDKDLKVTIEMALYAAKVHAERKQAEMALQESEAFKNTMIESSPDCIKLLDLEGNLTYMSKGGQEKLEIKDIKVYLNKSWIDFWQGADNINARMAVDTAVKGAIGKFRGYSPTETGIPRWWDVIITPLWGSNGEVEQVLAVSRDITELKQIEEELAKHHDHLEELVKERTRELQIVINSMSGREVRMAELKKVIKELRSQLEGAGMKPVANDPAKEFGKDYT